MSSSASSGQQQLANVAQMPSATEDKGEKKTNWSAEDVSQFTYLTKPNHFDFIIYTIQINI